MTDLQQRCACGHTRMQHTAGEYREKDGSQHQDCIASAFGAATDCACECFTPTEGVEKDPVGATGQDKGAKRIPLELDENGDPTEATLTTLRTWDPADGWGLLEALATVWAFDDYIRLRPARDPTIAAVSTGGWSANEALIEAVEENRIWWLFHWYSVTRGGHYVFKPKVKP